MQGWKVPHILKGILTWLPILYARHLCHASTGGTDSPRYCYRIWLRHLVTLNHYGFRIKGAHVGELGPGDSIGAGLAALLSGADRYVGLDVVPFSAKANLERIFGDLIQMYSSREPIPGYTAHNGYPDQAIDWGFPDQAIDWTDFADKVARIRSGLSAGMNSGQFISYQAPWSSPDDIAAASLDLVFSQDVLQYVDVLEETYQAMFAWLKPGSYSSHYIGFNATYLSPFWNGHWAYSDWEWRLVRGRRAFLLNREPLSTHLDCAEKAGFEVLLVRRVYGHGGLNVSALSPRFQACNDEDLQTQGAMLIMRKPF